MTPILQILRHHNLIYYTMNYTTRCIPEQNHPLRYWGVHADILPLLTQLTLRHLVVPAGGAAVERLFSVGANSSDLSAADYPTKLLRRLCASKTMVTCSNNIILLLVCDINIIPNGICHNSIGYDNLCAPDPIYYC